MVVGAAGRGGQRSASPRRRLMIQQSGKWFRSVVSVASIRCAASDAGLTLMLLAPRFEARERGVLTDLPTLPILWSDSDIVLSVVDALEIQAR
jgi:hypothetical protein